MTPFLILLLVLILVFAVTVFIFIQVIKAKNIKLKSNERHIYRLESDLINANAIIKSANNINKINTEAQKYENKILNTPDDDYDPNRMFDKFSKRE